MIRSIVRGVLAIAVSAISAASATALQDEGLPFTWKEPPEVKEEIGKMYNKVIDGHGCWWWLTGITREPASEEAKDSKKRTYELGTANCDKHCDPAGPHAPYRFTKRC